MHAQSSETKKVPKLRFPEFSREWEEKKLGDLVAIYDGTHQTPKYVKEGVPFYSVEHVTSNNFVNTKFISRDVFQKENKRVKLEKDDILMTRIGNVGAVKLIDWDVNASFYVSLALIKKSKQTDSLFLSQLIVADMFQKELWRRTIHAAFPQKINLGEISKSKLSLPSAQEQQKIASFLTNVDEWVENLREQKVQLELYKKGIMQKIFSQEIRFKNENGKDFPVWGEKSLAYIADISTGQKDVNMGNPAGRYRFYTCAKDFTYSDSYSFEGEAILIAGNAEVGLCHYYSGKFEAYQRTYVLQNFNILGTYLHRYLSHYFRQYAVGLKQTSAMSFIKIGMLNNFKVPVPSRKEQQKIAEFLTSLDNLIESKQKKISQTENWKKGLMQKMFV